MANRYWVGGSGTWDGSTTTHWSATSGGAGGASAPTISDAAIFNGSSGGGTVTVASSSICSTLNTTGFTGTLALGSNELECDLDIVIGSGTTITANSDGLISNGWNGSGSANLTTNGVDIKGFRNNIATTLQDHLTVGGLGLRIEAAFNANNKNLTIAELVSASAGGAVTMGSGTWTVTGLSWNAANLTLTPGTSTVEFTDTSNSALFFAEPAGGSFNVVWFNRGASTGYIYMFNTPASVTFGELKNTGTAAHIMEFVADSTCVVTTFTINGNGAGNEISLLSGTPTSAFNLSKSSGTVVADYMNITDSAAGGGATFNAVDSTDGGGNTGWNFLESFPPGQALL